MNPIHIRIDDLRGPEIAALLEEHLAAMRLDSPPESVHALDLDRLRQQDITFWTVWSDNQLLGCGAIKELDAESAEIKSMRTATTHVRRGVARRVLEEILATARKRAYRRLYLETGSTAAFLPAHRLYASFGFRTCGPFADYVPDDFSVFMVKDLP